MLPWMKKLLFPDRKENKEKLVFVLILAFLRSRVVSSSFLHIFRWQKLKFLSEHEHKALNEEKWKNFKSS